MAGEPAILERDPVDLWRLRVLSDAGYPEIDAHLIAADHSIDLHQAVYLAESGCPPELALRILL